MMPPEKGATPPLMARIYLTLLIRLGYDAEPRRLEARVPEAPVIQRDATR